MTFRIKRPLLTPSHYVFITRYKSQRVSAGFILSHSTHVTVAFLIEQVKDFEAKWSIITFLYNQMIMKLAFFQFLIIERLKSDM